MTRGEIFDKVVKIIISFAPKDHKAQLTESTHIRDNLGVNSARFVDIILELEDQFEITIDDSTMDRMGTIGAIVDEIISLMPNRVAPLA